MKPWTAIEGYQQSLISRTKRLSFTLLSFPPRRAAEEGEHTLTGFRVRSGIPVVLVQP